MSWKRTGMYSLGWRLSWLFAVQTFIGLGVLSAAIYVVGVWNLSAKADTELGRKIGLVRNLVSEAASSGDLPAMRHKLDEFFLGHDDMQVTLFDPRGAMAYESPGRVSQQGMQRSTRFDLPGSVAFSEASIILDRSGDARLLAGLAALLMISTFLGTIAVSCSGFWLVRRSLAPLRGLAEQTRLLQIDGLGNRLALDRPVEELQPWIEQFNDLLGRLDFAYRQLEAFNADVAHELRTPLATLIGQTEILLARDRTKEEMQETLGSNLEEVRRLSSIVNDMLFLARADRGAHARTAPPAELGAQIESVIEFYEGALSERGLVARVDGRARASFEPGLVRRAVSNLLANALRHAVPGTDIVVALHESGDQAWIEVRNRGPELPAGILPKLFERFFRGESSREGSSENHGLGLAIVAAIARMHGGSTIARSNKGVTSIGFSISARELAGHDVSGPGGLAGKASAHARSSSASPATRLTAR